MMICLFTAFISKKNTDNWRLQLNDYTYSLEKVDRPQIQKSSTTQGVHAIMRSFQTPRKFDHAVVEIRNARGEDGLSDKST